MSRTARALVFGAHAIALLLAGPVAAQQGGPIPPPPPAASDPCTAAARPSPKAEIIDKAATATGVVAEGTEAADRLVRSVAPNVAPPFVEHFSAPADPSDLSKVGAAAKYVGGTATVVGNTLAVAKGIEGAATGDTGAMLEGAASLEPTVDFGCDAAKTRDALMRDDMPAMYEGMSTLTAKGAACVAGMMTGGLVGCRQAMATVDGVIETGQWAAEVAIDAYFERETRQILERADSDVARRREEMRARRDAVKRQFERGNSVAPRSSPMTAADANFLQELIGTFGAVQQQLQTERQVQTHQEQSGQKLTCDSDAQVRLLCDEAERIKRSQGLP